MQPEPTAPGDRATLVLENGAAHAIGYNLCTSGLERRGDGWQPVQEERACTMELRSLAPGETDRFEVELPRDLPAGEYRYTTRVENLETGDAERIPTPPFRIEGTRPGGDATAGASAPCLGAERWTADGPGRVDAPARQSSEGEARQLAGLRWEGHDGCERFVLDLAAPGGRPAGAAGEVRARVLRDLGVVRVEMPGVESVDPGATDARLDGRLARAAYAFIAPDERWVSLDLHLGEPAEAAVMVLEDPARVAVDLKPGGGPVPAPAPRAERVVVLEPRPGPAEYPLRISGYARHFEANVVLRVEQDGRDVHEEFTTATSWADAWGHFSFDVADGPTGDVVLHVGEHSARDGSWLGVAVPLRIR